MSVSNRLLKVAITRSGFLQATVYLSYRNAKHTDDKTITFLYLHCNRPVPLNDFRRRQTNPICQND